MQYLTPFPGFHKTVVLAKRERALIDGIKRGQAPQKLAKLAEHVRESQIRLAKAALQSHEPLRLEDKQYPERIEALKAHLGIWRELAVEQIVAAYRSGEPTSRFSNRSARRDYSGQMR